MYAGTSMSIVQAAGDGSQTQAQLYSGEHLDVLCEDSDRTKALGLSGRNLEILFEETKSNRVKKIH